LPGRHGFFVWYELMTTDLASALAFYGEVMGWGAQDQSTLDLPYMIVTADTEPVAGLMNLPQEGLRNGAMPRWVGYVAVEELDRTAERVRRLGGTLYVPPTDSNIGRISVIADPQTATLALVDGLKFVSTAFPQSDKPGRVVWHELFAADDRSALAFYQELLGWHQVQAEPGSMQEYRMFSAGTHAIGGMFTKPARAPVPFWLYYFYVGDMAAALARVTKAGGQIFDGPFELLGDSAIARCVDPQGAMFAIQGTLAPSADRASGAVEIGWSSRWGGFSTKGRLVAKQKR
jgi:uncharacterized protein